MNRWKALLAFGAIVLAGVLGFFVYPGHTWLASTSQLYLPMLERLDAPGYLSRDTVATHPNLTATVYDEAALFLHGAAGMTLEEALQLQQLLFRIAGLAGLFLLARAAGLQRRYAVAVGASTGLLIFLPQVDTERSLLEPVPRTFSLGLVLLAAGLQARRKPVAAAFFGGLALLYDPVLQCRSG